LAECGDQSSGRRRRTGDLCAEHHRLAALVKRLVGGARYGQPAGCT
jgi:hypothetical protein